MSKSSFFLGGGRQGGYMHLVAYVSKFHSPKYFFHKGVKPQKKTC